MAHFENKQKKKEENFVEVVFYDRIFTNKVLVQKAKEAQLRER